MLRIPCRPSCKPAACGEVNHPPHIVLMYMRSMQTDDFALLIGAFDAANGGGVGYYKDRGAYHLYLLETEAPIARLKPTGKEDEVQIGYWSHRCRWEDVDDMGGVILSLNEALEFIANEGIFWTWT